MTHLKNKNLLSTNQYGFMEGRLIIKLPIGLHRSSDQGKLNWIEDNLFTKKTMDGDHLNSKANQEGGHYKKTKKNTKIITKYTK